MALSEASCQERKVTNYKALSEASCQECKVMFQFSLCGLSDSLQQNHGTAWPVCF